MKRNSCFLGSPMTAGPPDSCFVHRFSPGVFSCVKEGCLLRPVCRWNPISCAESGKQREGGKPTGKSSSDCIYFETTSTVNGSFKLASPRPCQFAGLSYFRRRIEPAQQIPLKARVGTVIGALAMGFSFVIFFDSSPPSAEDRVTDSLLVWTWFACGQSGLTPCRVRILKK